MIFLHLYSFECKIHPLRTKLDYMVENTGTNPVLGPNCMILYIIQFGPKTGLAPVVEKKPRDRNFLLTIICILFFFFFFIEFLAPSCCGEEHYEGSVRIKDQLSLRLSNLSELYRKPDNQNNISSFKTHSSKVLVSAE